jgi:hypothetical protein
MFYKFKKCVKHLIYAILSLFCFVFLIPFVSARTKTDNWWNNIEKQFVDFFIYDCNNSSGSGCGDNPSSHSDITYSFNFPYSTSTGNNEDFGKQGIISSAYNGYSDLSFVGFSGDRMKAGNSYNLQLFMCTNFSFPTDRDKLNFVLNGGTTAVNSLSADSKFSYQNTNISYLTDKPSSTTPSGEYYDCLLISSIVSPTDDLQWFNWELNNHGINFSSAKFYIFGFNIYDLGISSNSIEQIVNNSGFATASSVAEVKSATDEIKEEAKKTNDTLTDDDISGSNSQTSGFFDNFESGDTGSLMKIVKLPLKFLNSLNNTCQPIVINTGKMGNITIPCLSTSLYNINGIGQITNIVSLVLNGVICYGCIKSIVTTVEKLKNPNDDEIEVVDL